MRVEKFCIEMATINDTTDTLQLLTRFQQMKVKQSTWTFSSLFIFENVTLIVTIHDQEKIRRLRNSADAAHLFAYKFQSCGAAYLNTISSGFTVSISRKDCALGT